MDRKAVKYPIGQQSFEMLRNGGFLYVDKTMYIDKIVNGSQYYFLGRPRRFGKSLFLSTLKAFFEGKRELFKGLYAESMEWDWEPYPVIYLDLNNQQFKDDSDFSNLDIIVDETLKVIEQRWGIVPTQKDLSARFASLIRQVSEKSGKGVVILVDEYDKPLVNNLNQSERFETYRNKLAALYSNFKSSADYIRLVFLTGVSRFGKLSVFSGLNNISDISFTRQFAGICGISEEELTENFQEGIKALAEENERTLEEEILELKRWYDGYHFSKKSPDIYNPFSILQVLAYRNYSNYWISSGKPTLLAEQLKNTETDLKEVIHTICNENTLNALDIDNISIEALLYQTGYLTIKSYNKSFSLFHLGIPNEEVKQGFFEFLLPYYSSVTQDKVAPFIYNLVIEMRSGRVDDFMKRLQSLFAGFGHDLKFDEERNVQNAMLLIFSLVGMHVEAEVRNSDGRIDILVRTTDYVYIMELKYDKSAHEALDQIERKEYALPWAVDSRTVIEIGINYSTEKRRIDDWIQKRL
ncbi:MAG: ATP-binding protein [Muribaculaceae bacterium]|nr:ATP-binding protein [Muribaculaceae bacterium]